MECTVENGKNGHFLSPFGPLGPLNWSNPSFERPTAQHANGHPNEPIDHPEEQHPNEHTGRVFDNHKQFIFSLVLKTQYLIVPGCLPEVG
jgi:hypothetical protein